jgi:hypothetical protein
MRAKLSVAEVILVFLIATAIVMAVVAPFWFLWVNVVPYFWPEGPKEVIEPSYWMFVGGVLLVHWLTKLLGLRK